VSVISFTRRFPGFGTVLWLSIPLAMAGPLSGGCTGTQTHSGPVTVGRTAKVNYERGVAELEGKNIDHARRYFKFVQREFPYSRYAATAELRLADCEFAEENWAEAASAYRRFMRLHRTHPEVDHAAFRRGLAYHKMIPSDWFLVPPSHERDMSATRDSLAEFQSFLQRYPDSQYADEGEAMVRDCLSRLAQHEMYVARFYLRREKHLAAIGRTKVVEERYAKSGLVPEAMFVRAETYLSMDELEKARETFQALEARYPDSPEAGRARDYLQRLGVDVQPPARDDGGSATSDAGSAGDSDDDETGGDDDGVTGDSGEDDTGVGTSDDEP